MLTYPKIPRLLYLDTDAFIHTKAPLPHTYWMKTLNMFDNYPWTDSSPACAGIQFWINDKNALILLYQHVYEESLSKVHPQFFSKGYQEHHHQ